MELEWVKLPSSGPVPLRVNTYEAYKEILEQHGHLITPYLASKMANVSRQRIYNLLEQGKFTIIVAWGVVQLPLAEFERWAKSERKPGRAGKVKRKNRESPDRRIERAAELELGTESPSEESLTGTD